MEPLSLVAVILTSNEAPHIAECIATLLGWVNAVVVWDGGSSDATCTLAQRAGALVVQRPFDNFAAQRQAALESVNAEWILFVDADERVTAPLAAEVQQVIVNHKAVGYWLPRRNFIVDHETRAGGFFPDYQLRLLKRSVTHYDLTRQVHELPIVEGEVGYLAEPLLHYNYATWQQFHRKQQRYAAYEAEILAKRGIQARPHNFVLQPLREFRRRYITLGGWRDGGHGLRLALWLAWYYGFIPYWLLVKRATR